MTRAKAEVRLGVKKRESPVRAGGGFIVGPSKCRTFTRRTGFVSGVESP